MSTYTRTLESAIRSIGDGSGFLEGRCSYGVDLLHTDGEPTVVYCGKETELTNPFSPFHLPICSWHLDRVVEQDMGAGYAPEEGDAA